MLTDRTRRRYLYIGLALGVPLALFAVFAAIMGAAPIRVTGTLTLTPNSYFTSSYSYTSPCTTAGYSDITGGTPVVIRDADGRISGMGELRSGRRSGPSCVYSFDVDQVDRSDYYSVEVARRGEVTFTAEQVNTGNVHLILGG